MAKILTGIQSTGTPHLGNILGAIIPAIKMANESNEESYLFIANMHSLTQIKDKKTLNDNTFATAATWLAFDLDPKKSCFYRQSDVPEVTELAWYLSCFFPYQRLKLAHSFKDKAENLKDINSGLFSYPMLMSADILIYDANIVPVGKDQLQHLEMTRDVAARFNNLMGETFIIPEAKIQDDSNYVTGTDGQKMSKSKGNTIDIFVDDGYTKEELKMRNETKKILDDKIDLTATCVRLPISVSHSESVNIQFEKSFSLEQIKKALNSFDGCKVIDERIDGGYSTPLEAEGKDETFISRIREDKTIKNGLNLWIVSDNLLRGAALNAVEIAETLIKNNFYGK